MPLCKHLGWILIGPIKKDKSVSTGTSGSYKVAIDGKAVGESPKALFPVSAGSHTVQVKFYGKKFEKTVRLAPGTSTSIRPTF